MKKTVRQHRFCSMLAAAILAVAALGACRASPVSSGEKANLAIKLTMPQTRSGASAWPLGGFPVFISGTITVSGDGSNESDPVEIASATSASGIDSVTISAEVGIGNNRTITLYLVPDWDATAKLYSIGDNSLTLVKAYGASATADLRSEKDTALAMSLDVAETAIILPNNSAESYSLKYIDSADSGTATTIVDNSSRFFSDTAFDRFGRFYRATLSTSEYNTTLGGIVMAATTASGNASRTVLSDTGGASPSMDWDSSTDLLWYFSGDGTFHSCVPGTTATTWTYDNNTLSPQYPVFAVSNNQVYAAGFMYNEAYVLAKLSPASGNALTLDSQVPYAALKLEWTSGESTYDMTVTDMRIQDGIVYLTASYTDFRTASADLTNSVSRGALIAVNPDTLALIGVYGLNEASSYLTTADSPAYFYGPGHFVAIAPGKLIFTDEGFAITDGGTAVQNIDRLITFDTGTGTFTPTDVSSLTNINTTYALAAEC